MRESERILACGRLVTDYVDAREKFTDLEGQIQSSGALLLRLGVEMQNWQSMPEKVLESHLDFFNKDEFKLLIEQITKAYNEMSSLKMQLRELGVF